ncbi:NAD(P)-dependent oxidoreductase [Cylindrospermopsis raciborskii CENA303]|uniref:dTDP-4-dehydrorhamnose reductase n=1 Tax=Cylindrospermopsis raciborskii CENA303 TaxID=1170769 RepID=A0A1X4G5F0_9CYAN|nr:dTDP-4-dehydrorhamnose reductase [Cylindrospermopsis raciborskii]EFA71542.1 3-beta hydroxysteroid dehydrogenase/isomerase [Raphidiopsis brookii D9]OSO89729.1 NAD(P)-dependent oxidoreductase [Cylindrospermopsis raciborskii CENA303]
MKILLTGISGQVGWELQRSLMTVGDVICLGRNELDLSRCETITSTIREIKPDLIVNPAAYTAVDRAESEPDLAMSINGVAPGILAEEAKRLGGAIIHYSTDYVFDGNQNTPYKENDSTFPQNVYGKTKLAGEKAIQAVGVNHLIFRTSWVYGLRGNNFLLTMQRLAKEREEIRVVDDQIGSPTWSRMIAEVTAQMIAQIRCQMVISGGDYLANFMAEKGGIYHLSSEGKTSWYGFAKAILIDKFADDQYGQYKLQRLVPITTPEYPTPAPRPGYSLLDNQKLFDTFGLKISNWQQVLGLALDG